MLRHTTNNACHKATFLLTALATSIVLAQQGHAAVPVIPEAGVDITNIAYAVFYDPQGNNKKQVQSNQVQVNVSALYSIALTTPPVQKVTVGSRVIWLNTLTNTSNTSAKVQIDKLSLNGLNNIQIYIDSNKNGQFDASDELLTGTIQLARLQSVDLWIVATTDNNLKNSQQLDLPIKASVVESPTTSATATDSVTTYLPDIVIRKSVDQETFTPGVSKNYELKYTLSLENKGGNQIDPTNVMVDGQARALIIAIDSLPANTTYQSAQTSNPNAIILFRTGINSYTRQQPADKTLINEVIIGYPAIASGTTEQVQLVVKMNDNIAQTTLKNQFQLKYIVATGETSLQSNVAQTIVGGTSEISNNSGNFSKILATGTLNKPLFISANSTVCNANRLQTDQVKIRIQSMTTGDVVEVIGTETSANSGVFHYELPTSESANANPNDQILQTVKRDTVTVSLVSCLDAAGTPTTPIANVNTKVLINPYGIVFDAKTGLPVAGATVTLLDASGNPIGNNIAFDVDNQTGQLTSIPASQVTNARGEFIYPHVINGTYSFKVDTSTIPGATKYTFVSNKAVYPSFPSDKIVNPDWSYAGKFSLADGDPALNIDIPIDPNLVTATSSLFVQKTASTSTAELGDFEDYTVTVANRGNSDAQNVSIKDSLPRGFIYIPGTSRVNGVKVNDPLGGKGPYLTLGLGTLTPNSEIKVQYRVQIGPNSLNGDGINRVRAQDSTGIQSNEASAKVAVTPGVLMSDAFVVGKVFMDCNRNGVQDMGERGVPGIRIYMEDGSYVVTDREGKYDFYGVSAKTHVLKLDRSTLPGKAELILISNRSAGDPGSRFVDLKRGELHRADFAIADGAGTCTQPLIEQVDKRKAKIEDQNVNLEQVLRADLSLDPLRNTISDARSQPASGCISGQGITANCNIQLSTDQLKELRTVQIDPIKAPILLNLEKALEEAQNNHLEILNLHSGQTLPYAQTTIQIKGVAGTNIELWVNGKLVPDNRIGKKALLPDFQVAGFDYIGIELKTGNNTIEVRQLDQMGNLRDKQQIDVIAPDQMSKIALTAPAQQVQANGTDIFNTIIKIVDHNGTMVASRTPVTLESSIGKIGIKDLDDTQAGIQTFVEGGTLVVPITAPSEAGEGTLSVTSGVFNATTPVRFLPNLRPMIAVGIVEGAISFQNFDPKQLGQVTRNDGFEEELNDISSNKNGTVNSTGRAAVFLKGKVRGDYLLTLAYDSDKNKNQRLFRDIRPDEYYPVYGDAAAKGFDAQSTSKLYVRVDKGRSYAMYGDYVTRTENDEGLSLGQYNRSLTGARTSLETDHVKVTGFVARTNATQIVNEQRGLGITGPYSLGVINNDAILSNSEKVDVIVRDRNNPGLIISQRTLARFTDYEVDTFSNSLFLKTPVSSVDADLNPVYLRISVEADQGGAEYNVGGVSGSVKLTKQVKVGGSYVKSGDPMTKDQLSSVNTVVTLSEKAKFIAEYAQSSNTIDPTNNLTQINASKAASGNQSGDALRLEMNYAFKNFEIRAYHNQADSGFYNTASPITSGRKESGVKAQTRIEKLGVIHLEAIRTEDSVNQGVRDGVSASLERSLNRILTLEVGARYYKETANAASLTSQQLTPYDGTTLRTKITTLLPWDGSNAFAEYEQDIADSQRRIFALGGNYQINAKARIYARQEILSSINGLYELNDTQRRNTTVFGVENKYMQDGSVFSEYRVRDGISAREAEAAMGLRNRWQVKKGIYINTSFEKVQSLSGINNQSTDATAASIGVEYLTNPDWKAVARAEVRVADMSDTLLNTLGFSYKINDDVTLLTKNVFSQIDNKSATSGDRTVDRVQIGAAYRDFDQNRFDMLNKLEYRYENDATNLSSPYQRDVYILSNHVNYHPTRQMTWSGQYAVKHLTADYDGIRSTGVTQLLSGRAIYDINERWDTSINAGMLWSNASSGRRYLLGAEVGYLLAANLWLSGGYNFSGYRDDDLIDGDTTVAGPYLRFRFKFDENLLNVNNTRVNKSREPEDDHR